MKQSRRELKSKYRALQQELAEINQKMDVYPTGTERTELQNKREQCRAHIDRINSQLRIACLYASRRKWRWTGIVWILLFWGLNYYTTYQGVKQNNPDIVNERFRLVSIICGIGAGGALGRAGRITRMIRDEKSQTR